jgi:TolB protein
MKIVQWDTEESTMYKVKPLLILTVLATIICACGSTGESEQSQRATVQFLINQSLTETASVDTPVPTATLEPTPIPTSTETMAPSPTATPYGGGGRIAFASDRDGNFNIYSMNSDGGTVIRLTDNPFNDNEPVWSPDGEQLVFVSSPDNASRGLYLVAKDGSGRTFIARFSELEGGSPSWGANGRIAYWAITCTSFCDKGGYHRSVIYFIDPDGGNMKTEQPFISNRPLDPAWSPNARRLAVLNGTQWYNSLELITPDGDFMQTFSEYEVYAEPAWSPDGSILAVSSNEAGNDDIYIIYVDGTYSTRLTGQGDDRHPSWSPDGTQIVFSSNRNGNWDIYVINVDGSGERQLTSDPADDIEPSWGS